MTRVFVARLAALSVFDPLGDPVGRVRDVVVHFTSGRPAPRVLGLVVEVPGRRRVFVPMTRVTSVDAGQVITTGLVNMRRFEQRTSETLVLAELFERMIRVTTADETFEATVEDIAIEQESNRDWFVVKVFVRKGSGGTRSISRLGRRRGETVLVDIDQVTGLHLEAEGQSAAKLLESYEDLKPADLAEMIQDLNPKRRGEVAAALNNGDILRVYADLFQSDLGRKVRRRAESADGDSLALQILGPFDLRPHEQLVGNKVDPAGDDRRIRALQVRRDRQGSSREYDLQLISQQRLHRQRAAFQPQILAIESVLLKDPFLVSRPGHGMNRRGKTAAGDAEFFLRDCLPGQRR